MTIDAVTKIKEQPRILRFRENRGSPMPTVRQPAAAQKNDKGRLTHGQLVEVRSAQEITATLDADGKLDGVPFMPEMAIHCGRAFRIFRRADITCVEGHGLRRMNSTVFLEDVRCDGSAHDGCQRSCLIFWKEAWLKPVEIADAPSIVGEQSEPADTSALINLPNSRPKPIFVSIDRAGNSDRRPAKLEYPSVRFASSRRRTHDNAVHPDYSAGPSKFAPQISRFKRNWSAYRSEVEVV